MAGEKSKSSGEYGERIVSALLNLMGWVNCLPGKDIPCVMGNIHKGEGGNPRKNHGVDFVIRYSDPLMSRVESNILVSVKHRDKYIAGAAGRTTEFKKYLKDIAEATECYPAYQVKLPRISGTNDQRIDNVIIWISEADEEANTSVITDISSFRNSDNINFTTVYLVDNSKAAFLYSSIIFAKNISEQFYFYYPDTGYNMDTRQRTHQGHILPVQYINSPILLFKVDEETGSCLIITVNDEFSDSCLKRILQLARLITEGWASKIIIACPGYHDYNNSSDANKIINELQDGELKKKIKIKALEYQDFRNLGGSNHE